MSLNDQWITEEIKEDIKKKTLSDKWKHSFKKSMGKVIENNKLISGATILGDGEVALILDVNALF